jgi:hypothetical protein
MDLSPRGGKKNRKTWLHPIAIRKVKQDKQIEIIGAD